MNCEQDSQENKRKQKQRKDKKKEYDAGDQAKQEYATSQHRDAAIIAVPAYPTS